MPDPLQELLAAGAVPTTTFPPTSRYADVGVDAWDPGGGRPPVPFLQRRFCPRGREARAAVRGSRRRGRPPRRARRASRRATPSSGGASPTRTASSIHASSPSRSAARCASRCRRECPVPEPVRLQLMIGPGVPIPVPRAVLDAVQEVKVESNSGETQSGFEITFRISNRSPLQTLFLLTGGSSIPILRVVIAVTLGGETTVLMDGVMTHHEPAPTPADADADHEGQGQPRVDQHHPAGRASLPGDVPGRPRGRRARKVRRVRDGADGDSERPRGRADPDRADPAAPGDRLQLRQGARARGRLRLLQRPWPGTRREQVVLGPGDPHRRAAAPARPGARRRARDRQEPDLPLRQGEEGAADRLHPGAG